MVDFDIFSNSIGPEWRKAARASYSDVYSERACQESIKAASKFFHHSGFEALTKLLPIVSHIVNRDDLTLAADVFGALQSIKVDYPSDATHVACDYLHALIYWGDDTLCDPETGIEEMFTRRVLVRFIVNSITPAALNEELQRHRNWSANDVLLRQDRLRDDLLAAPDLANLAQQLMADPSGMTIKQQRFGRKKQVSLRELVDSFALTS